MTALIVLAVIATIILYAIVLYNRLVKFKQLVEEGWSGIDVQLKRRSDLIPNLLETVRGYMTHERETLERVTELRAQAQAAGGDVEKRGRAEGALGQALANLFAVAENYPDLKANQNFLAFQNSLSEIEDEIQLSRRYYNGAARNNNVLVGQFPSNLVASTFSFQTAEYFEIEDSSDRAVPKVGFES